VARLRARARYCSRAGPAEREGSHLRPRAPGERVAWRGGAVRGLASTMPTSSTSPTATRQPRRWRSWQEGPGAGRARRGRRGCLEAELPIFNTPSMSQINPIPHGNSRSMTSSLDPLIQPAKSPSQETSYRRAMVARTIDLDLSACLTRNAKLPPRALMATPTNVAAAFFLVSGEVRSPCTRAKCITACASNF